MSPTKTSGCTSVRGAFTLIEVLVVVAIIALLVAILMPSLASARNQAQAAVCLSNLKQCSNGVQIWIVEQQMRKERISTNFGWATNSFVANKEAKNLFACPADTKPLPMPPLYIDFWEGTKYHGRSSSDGAFNQIEQDPAAGQDAWTINIQDSVDEQGFGFDINSGDHDLLLKYNAASGAVNTDVSVKDVHSGWTFKVFGHKGQLIWDVPSTSSPSYRTPVVNLSYGANASAGLRGVKGNPLLIVESSRPGVFPESFPSGKTADDLRRHLRFRHGGKLADPKYSVMNTAYDNGKYVPKTRVNGAFLDGHAEGMSYAQVTNPSAPDVVRGSVPDVAAQLAGHREIWLGNRRTDANLSF